MNDNINSQTKQNFLNLLNKGQYIITPEINIINGQLQGFQYYGILGCKLKNLLIKEWKKYFINNSNNIEEIDYPTAINYDLMHESNYIEDYMEYIINDNNKIYSIRDFLKKWILTTNNMTNMLERIDKLNIDELKKLLYQYKIIPETKNIEKKTQLYAIESSNINNVNRIDFLRPDLSQQIIANFELFNNFFNDTFPFGIAQIGKIFRKEIKHEPFIKLRENTHTTIVYFYDPLNLDIENNINNTNIMGRKMQMDNIWHIEDIPLNDKKNIQYNEFIEIENIINNKHISKFITHIYKFCINIGILKHKIRLRKLETTNILHSWVIEIYVNKIWLICAKCSNRALYEILYEKNKNIKKAKRKLKQPLENKELIIKINEKNIIEKYHELTPKIIDYYSKIDENEKKKIQNNILSGNNNMWIYIDGLMCAISCDMINCEEKITIQKYEEFIPHILDITLNLDQILYCLLEHCYISDQKNMCILSLPYNIAPYQVLLCINNDDEDDVINNAKNIENINIIMNNIKQILDNNNVRYYIDLNNNSIDTKKKRMNDFSIKNMIIINDANNKYVLLYKIDNESCEKIEIDKIFEKII